MKLYESITKNVYARALAILSRPYFRDYRNFDNIPRRKGNVIFIANHNSLLDSFLLTPHLILRTGKIVYILGDRKVWRSNLFYRFITRMMCNAILMDRDKPSDVARALVECARRLKKGGILLIFPEGTRGIPNNIAQFKSGIYAIAFRAQSSIVPIYLGNVPLLSYKGKRFPGLFRARFRLSINVGSEIGYTEYSSYKGRRSKFCQYLREKVSGLHC